MRRRITALILVVFLIFAVPMGAVSAEEPNSGSCGENVTWKLDESGMLTVSGTGDMTDYADWRDQPWADLHKQITGVTVEDGVTSIGDHAFSVCTAITTVTMADSVVRIGDSAFDSSDSIRQITMSRNVTSIGDRAFFACGELTEFYIPDTVVSIGTSAFAACYRLPSITIPGSVRSIGDLAFSGCSALREITFLGDAPTFGKSIFASLTGQPTVYITAYYPAGNSTWTSNVMQRYGCDVTWTPVGSTVQYSGSCGQNVYWTLDGNGVLTVYGHGPMADYTVWTQQPWNDVRDLIKTIVIEDGVTTLGNRAFAVCPNLTSVSIPNSVTFFNWGVFHDCVRLSSIYIPASVTSIMGNPFPGCFALSEIVVDPGNPVYHSSGNCLIETGRRMITAGCRNSVIPSNGSVTGIDGSAFYACTGLKAITLPDCLTSIGSYAFAACSGLRTVAIPESVVSIGEYAFAGSGLTEIIFTGDAPVIGANAFASLPDYPTGAILAYHPEGNGTWTEPVMQNYGGTLNWLTYADGTGNGQTEPQPTETEAPSVREPEKPTEEVSPTVKPDHSRYETEPQENKTDFRPVLIGLLCGFVAFDILLAVLLIVKFRKSKSRNVGKQAPDYSESAEKTTYLHSPDPRGWQSASWDPTEKLDPRNSQKKQ